MPYLLISWLLNPAFPSWMYAWIPCSIQVGSGAQASVYGVGSMCPSSCSWNWASAWFLLDSFFFFFCLLEKSTGFLGRLWTAVHPSSPPGAGAVSRGLGRSIRKVNSHWQVLPASTAVFLGSSWPEVAFRPVSDGQQSNLSSMYSPNPFPTYLSPWTPPHLFKISSV